MYPDADVPVLQMSMPTFDPERLFESASVCDRSDEGVLIVGSGFLTHGLPFLRDFRPDADPRAGRGSSTRGARKRWRVATSTS